MPLSWWKANETSFPGLAAMARDILCIPVSSTLVERVFCFSRDICDYRRGALAPGTIRSIMLVFYRQKTESKQFQRQTLSMVMDTHDLTEEDINIEYQAQVNKLMEKLDLQYIPDLHEEPPLVAARTARNELARSQKQSRRRRQLEESLPKRYLARDKAAEKAQQKEFEQRDRESRRSRIYEFDMLSDTEHNNGDYPLPKLLRNTPNLEPMEVDSELQE